MYHIPPYTPFSGHQVQMPNTATLPMQQPASIPIVPASAGQHAPTSSLTHISYHAQMQQQQHSAASSVVLPTSAAGPTSLGQSGASAPALYSSSKATFLAAFENLFDSLPDVRVLQAHIDEMLDNAAVNIGKEIESDRARRSEWEAAMDRRFDDFKRTVSDELVLLEKRLEKVEKGVDSTPRGAIVKRDRAHTTSFPTPSSSTLIQSLEDRIAQLERHKAARGQDSVQHQQPSRAGLLQPIPNQGSSSISNISEMNLDAAVEHASD